MQRNPKINGRLVRNMVFTTKPWRRSFNPYKR